MKNIFDLSHEGGLKDTVLFYVSYFFIAIMLSGAIGFFVGTLILPDMSFEKAMQLGNIFAVLFYTSLSIIIICKKRLWMRFWTYIVLSMVIIGSSFGGALIGLFFVSSLYAMSPLEKDI